MPRQRRCTRKARRANRVSAPRKGEVAVSGSVLAHPPWLAPPSPKTSPFSRGAKAWRPLQRQSLGTVACRISVLESFARISHLVAHHRSLHMPLQPSCHSGSQRSSSSRDGLRRRLMAEQKSRYATATLMPRSPRVASCVQRTLNQAF